MLVESLSSKQLKSRAVGWAVATAVSAALFTEGVYGWSKEGEKPLSQQCQALESQVSGLGTDLLQSGTLGWNSGLIFRSLDIRNPDDPRLRTWGQLKNEKDRVCNELQREYINSFEPLVHMAAIVGGTFTLLGIKMFLDFKRALSRKHPSTTGITV